MNTPKPTFSAFLQYFKEHELPVTLIEESLTAFQVMNDPLPAAFVNAFIEPYDENANQDFTEYVPCFKIPETPDMHALIFWKGELMKYQYYLVVYDNKGQLMDNAVIGGIQSDGKTVLRSVATVDEDWTIHIVEGEQPVDEEFYKSSSSRAYQMELLASGKISLTESDSI